MKIKHASSSPLRSTLQEQEPAAHLETPSAFQSLETCYWWAPRIPPGRPSPCRSVRRRLTAASSRYCETCHSKAEEKRKVTHASSQHFKSTGMEGSLPRWTVGNPGRSWWWRSRRVSSHSSQIWFEVPKKTTCN